MRSSERRVLDRVRPASVIALAAVLALGACTEKQAPAPPPAEVVVTEAVQKDVPRQLVQGEGEARVADPRLVAGEMLQINGVGKKYSGEYYITEARHVGYNGIYTVSFNASGRTPNIFYHLFLGPRAGLENNKIQGVVPALVTDTKDPDKMGRVKVKYPTLPPNQGAELASPRV